jgi:hypothetical protein
MLLDGGFRYGQPTRDRCVRLAAEDEADDLFLPLRDPPTRKMEAPGPFGFAHRPECHHRVDAHQVDRVELDEQDGDVETRQGNFLQQVEDDAGQEEARSRQDRPEQSLPAGRNGEPVPHEIDDQPVQERIEHHRDFHEVW